MDVDKGSFFREFSVRICGSLEIDKALGNAFRYVGRAMPLDELMVGHTNIESGIMEFVATADRSGGSRKSTEVAVSEPVKKRLAKGGYHPNLLLIDDHGREPLMVPAGEAFGWPPSSLLVNRLVVGGRRVGFLIARAEGTGRYTSAHGALWTSVTEPAAIALSNYLTHRELFELKERLADDNRFLKDELRMISGTEIIGSDFGLKEVMFRVQHVAPLTSPVLLQGETGTGKEVIANAIHNLSPRSGGPFIRVNCGAIPDTLIDSELFGHEKGAFTGAVSRKMGRFERASGGTIFLDEIGELPHQAQVRLLRVLQENEIERVGGTETVKVDIRVISGTHRDIERMVREGSFREDLYFRLKVFPIALPPLRERKADIPVLVQHILKKKAQALGLHRPPVLSPGVMDRLLAYPWPGNIRELENVIERAIILSDGKPLEFLDGLGAETNPSGRAEAGGGSARLRTLDSVVRGHIEEVLRACNGHVEGAAGAAKALGLNPSTLRFRMRRLGIPYGRKARSGS
ncbi:MAG: Formate hydrogenlyase transcriptional activator [Syntrophaceae bacterium PtaU1.Bin231]|nr:MAG: Formate hydrogenlyase transcriptional activator [Syntrophaceae bacterium PtaU1.Bin231]